MIGNAAMRTARFFFYFLAVFGTMLYWQSDNTFCLEKGRYAFIAPCAALSLLCATLDLIAFALLGNGQHPLPKKRLFRWNWLPAIVSAGIVGLGALALPIIMYGSYGIFGMRCLITEGYGMVFEILFIPLLGVLTFACNLLEPLLRKKLAKG
ncbi:hypothetical protein [Silvibacterium dinghuense]|uniref:Uncharacterized protein n=1 Tax=Silvibacterium dinghuense TaxID=1560006 RepID=A0A4Q1SI40_9BACT|nr:hypothetical protein [Silvibacterium dinghuense]RXS97246.1 hypothetical protein ESZ00_04860 [Silvibacterium dinghuense]GGG97417.1 hypothetical protein GCM10011586_10890 [Silvibacterium dinghuense]